MVAVKIRTGEVSASKRGNEVTRDEWPRLLEARREFCSNRFQTDCRALLFYIKDGRENGFFGYPDEETYCREGLWLEPEAVAFALTYLTARKERLRGHAVSFEEAQRFGREMQVGEARDAPPIPKKGTIGRGRPSIRSDNITPNRGTQAAYLLRRLARDHPDLLDSYERGEYPSARAAAIAAGIIHPPTRYQVLSRAWEKASEDDRQRFLRDRGLM